MDEIVLMLIELYWHVIWRSIWHIFWHWNTTCHFSGILNSIQHFIWQSLRRFTSHRHYATWHFIWHIFWFCIWHPNIFWHISCISFSDFAFVFVIFLAILIYSDTLPGIHHLAPSGPTMITMAQWAGKLTMVTVTSWGMAMGNGYGQWLWNGYCIVQFLSSQRHQL